ncbi:MAG: bifunctional diguanylate cyclase/phosphodiesterase [Myxococcales bacterium]|nr:bifunctional diguanylate cyclase/phosphodiesterase [Myxococcales bacterium]
MTVRTTCILLVAPRTPLLAAAQELAQEHGTTVLVVADAATAVARLGETKRPLVLVDLGRGERLSDELVALGKRAPLILIGDGASMPRVARWTGADDYLFARELTVTSLERAVGHAIERRRAQATVQHLMTHDPVTGAPHAAAFRSRLMDVIDRASLRAGGRAGLMLVDLDRFDVVNETFGFEAGDTVLREAVHRLQRLVGSSHLARFHADKLAIMFDETANQGELVQSVRTVLEKPYVLERQEVHLTASMGIAEYPSDAGDADNLIRATSKAMRRAKHVGRNNVQLASATLGASTHAAKPRERFALERDLRLAVDRGELLLHYQPQLDVRTGAVLGVEALVRWMRPGVGMISPADFVPLLEETGLIVPASDWILQTACQQIADWMGDGLPPLRVAVNVSATQIRQRRLLSGVEQALHSSGLAPNLLELELTEGLLIENTAASGSTLDAVRELGASISLDDFGTGYSSLSYLKRLPIDVVKIDRSFLREIPQVATDAAITSAIITLAHELGHRVVAEGVETAEQLDFLEKHDCDAVQGFYFSKPLPADKCLEWILARTRANRGTSGTYLAPDVALAPANDGTRKVS